MSCPSTVSTSEQILDAIRGMKVLVIGDLMLDHYVWGEVHRISPEAPVPVILAERESWNAGGAANVSLNLAKLGARTKVMGSVGTDEAGDRLKCILASHSIELIQDGSRKPAPPTIVKSRVIARTQQVCRIDRESGRESYKIDNSPKAMSLLSDAVTDSDIIIISDYAKGVVTDDLIAHVQAHGEREQKFVAIDPKPCQPVALNGLDLITPNRFEALQLAGMAKYPPTEAYPLREVCRRINELYRPKTMVVTLGAEGMAVSRNGEVEAVLPTFAREVFDVSGAGDTVVAVLAAAMGTGATAVQAAELANAAAGCVVAHVGTVPVELEELIAFLAK